LLGDVLQIGVIDYSLYLKEILSQPAPEEERYIVAVYYELV